MVFFGATFLSITAEYVQHRSFSRPGGSRSIALVSKDKPERAQYACCHLVLRHCFALGVFKDACIALLRNFLC